MSAQRFVSEALVPGAAFMDTPALSAGEPPLPRTFRWRDAPLEIATIERTWRSTNPDRGDDYLARHWFEVRTTDERVAVLYFDRKARRESARWWLYTISDD